MIDPSDDEYDHFYTRKLEVKKKEKRKNRIPSFCSNTSFLSNSIITLTKLLLACDLCLLFVYDIRPGTLVVFGSGYNKEQKVLKAAAEINSTCCCCCWHWWKFCIQSLGWKLEARVRFRESATKRSLHLRHCNSQPETTTTQAQQIFCLPLFLQLQWSSTKNMLTQASHSYHYS